MTTTMAIDKQLPEFIRIFEVTLRSGYSLKQSLEIVLKDMEGPITADVEQLLHDLEAGHKISQALSAWLDRSPSVDLDLFIATCKVQFEVGGNLADKLQLLSQIMEKRALS